MLSRIRNKKATVAISPDLSKPVISKFTSFVSNHPLTVLSSLMLITSIIVFFQFLFQKQVFIYQDIGSDTQNVYYPFFISLQRKLATGDYSMWDFTYGLGTNIITRQTDVGNIFTWFACLFGAGAIKYVLVITQIIKILLSGYICYFYLDTFKFSTLSKVVFSYTFAFNGFTILWGQHYFFANASLYIVLALLAIEKSFVNKNGYLLMAFATFAAMVNSYYLAYMILLVSAIYALFRLMALYSFKEFGIVAKKIGGLICAVLVGAAMSAFLFLPAVSIIMGTSSRIGSTSLIEGIKIFASSSYDSKTVHGIFARLFSNNLTGSIDYSGPLNYYEMPQWFFTSFILFFSIIFISEIFFNKQEKIKIKILKLISVALVILLAFHPFLSFILNGFVCNFFRYTYLIMPLFAVCFAGVLDKIANRKLTYGKTQIIVAFILSLLVMLSVILKTNHTSNLVKALGYLYAFMTVILATLAIVIISKKTSAAKRALCLACVTLLIISNVVVESNFTTNRRTVSSTNPKIYLTSGNDDVAKALQYLEETDKSFYRTDKTFQDIALLNDSLLQGYYGVSTYNSVINKNIPQFADTFCPDFKILHANAYYDFREIYDNVSVCSLLGVKYILSHELITNIPEYSYVKTFGTVHLYKNDSVTNIGRFYTNSIDYESYLSLSDEEKLKILDDTIILDNTNEPTLTAKTSSKESSVSFEKPKNSSHVSGSVNAKQDGYVFLPIPLENGWKAYVDGKETEIVLADLAFSAVRVSEGTHTVEFKYNTPLLKEGCIISVVGLIVFAIWSAVLIFHNKKNRG